MDQYRSILENLKSKNVKGLDQLSNKYLKEYILERDDILLKKSVIAKAVSYITDIGYDGDIEELFYQNIEIVNMAKEHIATKLYNIGFSYSRIAELLNLDMIDIIHIIEYYRTDLSIEQPIYMDESAILSLVKANMLDILSFLDINIITYTNSKDIRARAIYRNSRIKLIEVEPYEYRPGLYLLARPIMTISYREMGLIKHANLIFTADKNLLDFKYKVKDRIETYTNRIVMIDQNAIDEIERILSKLRPLADLIGYAVKKGYDIGNYESPIYID